MNIPEAKNLDKYRADKAAEKRAETLKIAREAFEEEFERRALEGVKSFRFMLTPHFVEVGQDLHDEVKAKGYVAMIVNDDFYGPVLHVELGE